MEKIKEIIISWLICSFFLLGTLSFILVLVHKDLFISFVFTVLTLVVGIVFSLIWEFFGNKSPNLFVLKAKVLFRINIMKQMLRYKTYKPEKLLFIAAIFLPSNIRETSLGDMEEVYEKDVKRFGVKKAKWLLAKDIFVSNYPILKEFARKSVIKVMKLAGLYEVVRRIIG